MGRYCNAKLFQIVCRLYCPFTLETVLATAFGRIVDLQRGESDEFVRAAREFFRSDFETSSISAMVQVPLIGTCMIAFNSSGIYNKYHSR